MNRYLSLTRMHEEGPGSLEVIFGPDGGYEDAPMWSGPVRMMRKSWPRHSWLHVTQVEPNGRGLYGAGGWAELESCSLDTHVPSVATRLTGLCAHALGITRFLFDGALFSIYQQGSWIHLAAPHGGLEATWTVTGWPYDSWARGVDIPRWGEDDDRRYDRHALLCALSLALAPKIAELEVP